MSPLVWKLVWSQSHAAALREFGLRRNRLFRLDWAERFRKLSQNSIRTCSDQRHPKTTSTVLLTNPPSNSLEFVAENPNHKINNLSTEINPNRSNSFSNSNLVTHPECSVILNERKCGTSYSIKLSIISHEYLPNAAFAAIASLAPTTSFSHHLGNLFSGISSFN
jgi:hypothetical protein